MSFSQAMVSAFRQYSNFSGRASRSEYWWFFLFQFVVGLLLIFIFTPLYFLFAIATILPYLALLVRRLHDSGRTGWWALLSLIPFGGLVLLIFAFSEGTPGENQYGPNPVHKASGNLAGGASTLGNPDSNPRWCIWCGSELFEIDRHCGACGRKI